MERAGGGKAEERKKQEERRGQIRTFLSSSSHLFRLCVFLLNFLGVFHEHYLKGSWGGGGGPPSVYLPLTNGIPFLCMV